MIQERKSLKELIRKERYKLFLSALPAFVLMIVIFMFSSKNATQSNATSEPIAVAAVTIYEQAAGKLETAKRQEVLEELNFIVRKAAHMGEYAVLAIFICIPLCVLKFSGRKLFLCSVAASAVYAITDEFHQLFVPGRSGQWKDVFIDTAGAAIGASIILLLMLRKTKSKKNMEKQM